MAVVCPLLLSGQEPLSLQECLDYALEHNLSLQKDKLAIESAYQSKREIVGSLLPQLSASGGFTDNLQKTRIIMPNFLAGGDPNADKYLTVIMGTDLNANWGFQLSQQILNFSLFNAVGIAKTAQQMAQTGVEISIDDLYAQTSTLYFNIQSLEYAVSQFDESIEIMDRTLKMMEIIMENGILRKVDTGQIQVTKINLETEKGNLEHGLEVQKRLLKLQMGFEMTDDIKLYPLDIDYIEDIVYKETLKGFNVYDQLAYKMVKSQQQMLTYQKKSAVSETLPALVFTGTYSHNYLGDQFSGPTYQHFPVSMLMLNLKVPIFTGLSKNAKIRKADIELQKSQRDEELLIQSLTMGYNNARNQLDQNRRTVYSQRKNKELAQEVMSVTENNYSEGLSSLSDMLNANSSMIQAQMNYINALNKCVKAYIDLRKAEGTIQQILK